jgi:hypothetical protein
VIKAMPPDKIAEYGPGAHANLRTHLRDCGRMRGDICKEAPGGGIACGHKPGLQTDLRTTCRSAGKVLRTTWQT